MLPVTKSRETSLAYAMLFLAPMFLSTNMVFGRAILSVEPFTLATLRWLLTTMVLLVVCRNDWQVMIETFRTRYRLLFLCGFLALWVCGGIVYLGLHYTTATNGILIYTTTPLIIIAIESIWRGRQIRLRELLGIAIAISGVFVIIARGEITGLSDISFNPGDLLFVAAAISWAIYTVLLKTRPVAHLNTLPLLTLVCCCGTLLLVPFAVYETISLRTFPSSGFEWSIIMAIVVISSLFSFSSYQYGIRILGASIAGIFMYLLPPFGLVFAWAFLGERLEAFHASGTLLILGGVIAATLPVRMLRQGR